MKVKIKICGVRSLEVAKVVISSGADFIGLNFIPTSKRHIDILTAKQIANFAKDKIGLVGVFQNASTDEVNKIAELLQLDFIQLHGKEDNDYIKKMNRPVIKSIYGNDIPNGLDANFLLLDRKEQGHGDLLDLVEAKNIADKHKVFFAGGLTPDNVVLIIEKVKPYAIDVAGGVETDGQQDLDKIKQFIKNAKGVEI